jgi:hypothetical protein
MAKRPAGEGWALFGFTLDTPDETYPRTYPDWPDGPSGLLWIDGGGDRDTALVAFWTRSEAEVLRHWPDARDIGLVSFEEG